MAHNNAGARSRHTSGMAARRGSHGGSFDPTAATNSLYGGDMDYLPVVEGPSRQGEIPGDTITDGSIGAAQLGALAVLEDALADNAIAQRHLQDLVVGNLELQALSVDTAQLRANSVITEKILAGSITSDLINVAGLLAQQIRAGTLTIGGIEGVPDFLNVVNAAGALIMQVSKDGFFVFDANNPDAAMRFQDGTLAFSRDFTLGVAATWSTAINAEGIRADSILVGKAPGGHNLIPNSSFENTPFSVGLTKVWTSAADWGTTIGTDVNIDKSTVDLKLTTATF